MPNYNWTIAELEARLAEELEDANPIQEFAFLTGCLVGVVIDKSDDPIALYIAREIAMRMNIKLNDYTR